MVYLPAGHMHLPLACSGSGVRLLWALLLLLCPGLLLRLVRLVRLLLCLLLQQLLASAAASLAPC